MAAADRAGIQFDQRGRALRRHEEIEAEETRAAERPGEPAHGIIDLGMIDRTDHRARSGHRRVESLRRESDPVEDTSLPARDTPKGEPSLDESLQGEGPAVRCGHPH